MPDTHACKVRARCAERASQTTNNPRRWQRGNGADFVFYDPHPGFTDGTAEKEYYRLICDTFQHAMHIVVERGQRNICKVAPGLTRAAPSSLPHALLVPASAEHLPCQPDPGHRSTGQGSASGKERHLGSALLHGGGEALNSMN